MSRPGGNLTSASHLTTRQWLQQRLPYYVTDFGPTPSRRSKPSRRNKPDSLPDPLPFLTYWEDVPRAVDDFVAGVDDSTRHLLPFELGLFMEEDNSESTASVFFTNALRMVGFALGHKLSLVPSVPVRSSPGPHVGADQRAAILAASPTQRADWVVTVDGKRILVVEMKRPAVFRRSVDSSIPRLYRLGERVSGAPGPEPPSEDVVRVEPVQQLYGYMVRLNLAWGILSSFDLTYVAHRQGLTGETLLVSEGIPSTSPRFLGLLAYMLQKAIYEPSDFKTEAPKFIPPIPTPGSLKSQGSKGDNKGKEKEKSGKRQSGGMVTRSQGPVRDGLPETPAELLHLARHHFATGWSGKIVRGTYEGQSIVVKLAPIGSDRAEALMREVSAYDMLKEFWGKYVPQLVSYGTTAGGTIMYIATEEFNGYEIGMGPLSQEVVEEIFDALAAVHQCGILHGDIRPSNILVAQGQRACVRFIDFGFACFGTSEEGCKREYAQLESLVSEFTFSGVSGVEYEPIRFLGSGATSNVFCVKG